MDMPLEPLYVEGGYFMMVDVSKCRSLVPAKYFESHEYEGDPDTMITKNKIYTKEGKIPLDLAFCRWMAFEKKVIMMPGCIFYYSGSPLMNENYVRLAICRGMEITKTAVERMK